MSKMADIHTTLFCLIEDHKDASQVIAEATKKRARVQHLIKSELVEHGLTDCLTINWAQLHRTMR